MCNVEVCSGRRKYKMKEIKIMSEIRITPQSITFSKPTITNAHGKIKQPGIAVFVVFDRQ